jgi:hypothetical protein
MLLLGGAAAALLAPAGASEEQARVVDRTYMCSVAVHNGVRQLTTRAARGFREDGRTRWFASVSVTNAEGGPPAKLPPTPTGQIPIWYTNWEFAAFAGLDVAHPEPSPPLQPYRAGLSVTPRRACTASRARVPLAPRGLDGFPADYFGDEVECVAPAKVLVRVRAVFAVPASFRLDRSRGELRTQRASGAVREAAVAVQAMSGRPLVYASAAAGGVARLFDAAGCIPT